MSLTQFLNMGGYAAYVWSSYGIALIVLLVNIVLPARQRRRLLADIARRARRASKSK
jgi:heme exporter protein D